MRWSSLLLLGALASACESPTGGDSTVATVTVSPAAVVLDAIEATRFLSAEVRDSGGRVVSTAVPVWTSSNPGVASVSAEGAVTAVSPGSATVTAGVSTASGSAQVTVAPVPLALEGASGDRQVGGVNQPLPGPLVVRALDRLGNPVAGALVSFTPTFGGGSADPPQASSDANGEASTTWTLGASSGAQSLTASLGSGPSVLFSATATSQAGLTIELEYLTPPTQLEMQAFDQAVERWAQLIPGRLQPVAVQLPAGQCGANSPAISRVVNDILVLVSLDSIDGERGTLGRTRVCGVRASSGLAILSTVTLDVGDVERLDAAGLLVDMILHELAHALGLGTLWRGKGLLADPSSPDNPGSDTHFTGLVAIRAFDAIGGASYGGAKVPVENTGSTGTRNAHWRASVLPSELMTGFLNAEANPVSRVTVASMADLGYLVDEAAADVFQIALAAPARVPVRHEPIVIGADIEAGPIYVIDVEGRIRDVLEW